MADYTLTLQGPRRALGNVTVDTEDSATFEVPIEFPVDVEGDLDTDEFLISVLPLDEYAADGHYVDGATQDQTTGFIIWTLHNITAGQGESGTFRVDVQRLRR